MTKRGGCSPDLNTFPPAGSLNGDEGSLRRPIGKGMIPLMPEAAVRAARAVIADDVEFGKDVVIEGDDVQIGRGCRIGFSGDDAFRTPDGVRLTVRSLV